jgi:hypothetical protein
MHRATGNRTGLALALQESALAALNAGDISAARAELAELTRLSDELGDAFKMYHLQNLGLLEYLDGAREPARAFYVRALTLTRSEDASQRANDGRAIPYTLLGLALTTSPTEPEQATELHGVADRLLDETGETFERLERRLRDEDHQRLTARLGPERFHAAHAAGRARPLDDIINTILGA